MTLEIPFNPPPENLAPVNGDIHVFCASLDQPLARMEQLVEMLSADERRRAARFMFERDKNRFVAGRGMLREILGWLLRRAPDELVFAYGFHGKPRLATAAWGNFLHFNLAHSDSLVAYAVARESEIGIDVERIRPVYEAEEIAALFFPESERAQLRSLPAAEKTTAFFDCWTRREALLKASGEGIGEAFNQMKIPTGTGLFDEAQYAQRSLTPAVGYAAAVAAKYRAARIHCWEWQPQTDCCKFFGSVHKNQRFRERLEFKGCLPGSSIPKGFWRRHFSSPSAR